MSNSRTGENMANISKRESPIKIIVTSKKDVNNRPKRKSASDPHVEVQKGGRIIITEKSIEPQKPKYKKDKRPCFFCKKFFVHLSTHYHSKHQNEPEIKKLENANVNAKQQIYQDILKKAINQENHVRMGTGEPILVQRKSRQAEPSIAVCKNCKSYMTVRGLSKHKVKCFKDRVPLSKAKEFNVKNSMDKNLTEGFKELLETLHMDEVGKEVRSDKEILFIADLWYQNEKAKTKESKTIRNRVSVIMRSLVRLKNVFNNLPAMRKKEKKTLVEIFRVSNFNLFEEALNRILHEDSPSKKNKKVKPGTSNQFQTTLKAAFNGLQFMLTVNKLTEERDLLNEFIQIFQTQRGRLLGEVGAVTLASRISKREISKLPTQEEMDKVKKKCREVVKRIKSPQNEHEFIEMRRAVITRIILLNGRRPAEVASVTLEQLQKGLDKVYIHKEAFEKASMNERREMENTLVIYNLGKGAKEIPILITQKWLIKSLKILADLKIREKCGILKTNQYLFPSGKMSLTYSNGTDNVTQFMKSSGLKNVRSVDVRHMLSTSISSKDLPVEIRPLIAKFFGHSVKINESVYSAPQAYQMEKHIVPLLQSLDHGDNDSETPNEDPLEGSSSAYPRAETTTTHLEPESTSATNLEGETPTTYSNKRNLRRKMYGAPPRKKTITEKRLFQEPTPICEEETDSSSSDPETFYTPSKKKRRMKDFYVWTDVHVANLRREFQSFINGETRYPNKKDVSRYVAAYQPFIGCPEMSKEHQNFIIRTKLNNEKRKRNTRRERVKKRLVMD